MKIMSNNFDLERISTENVGIISNSLKMGGVQSIPLNVNVDGTAYTIKTRSGCVAWSNLLCGGGHYPSTAVLEITEDE